jgi:hypothetical protein
MSLPLGPALLPAPTELSAIADRIGGHAIATRARAFQLGAAVASTDWRGLAATAFRAEAYAAIAAMRGSAGRLDEAADALRRHAGRVWALCDDVRDIGVDALGIVIDPVARPGRLLSDGKRLLSDGAGLVGDALSLVGI